MTAKINDLENNEIQMNFWDHHSNYLDAWSYVTKEDTELLHSENYPDLSSGYLPVQKLLEIRKRSVDLDIQPEKRSFHPVDLWDMILAKIIKNKSQLLKFVYEQKQEDKRDLPLYVLNNIDKNVKLSNAT